MGVLGRKGKAWDRWRTTARFIDLHETKVTVMKTARIVETIKASPSIDQILQEMIDAAHHDWLLRDPNMPDPSDHTPRVKYLNPDAWIV